MASGIWINIGSGNGLLPDGTKPLPEPMLTYHLRVVSQKIPQPSVIKISLKTALLKFDSNHPGANELIWKCRLQNGGHFVLADVSNRESLRDVWRSTSRWFLCRWRVRHLTAISPYEGNIRSFAGLLVYVSMICELTTVISLMVCNIHKIT